MEFLEPVGLMLCSMTGKHPTSVDVKRAQLSVQGVDPDVGVAWQQRSIQMTGVGGVASQRSVGR